MDDKEKEDFITLHLLSIFFQQLQNFELLTEDEQLEMPYIIGLSLYLFKIMLRFKVHVGEFTKRRNCLGKY